MTSIAQFIKTSEYVCTGRDPVQALAVFLNELIILILYTTIINDKQILAQTQV